MTCLRELQEGHRWLNYPLRGGGIVGEGQRSGCVPKRELLRHQGYSFELSMALLLLLGYRWGFALQRKAPKSSKLVLFRRTGIDSTASGGQPAVSSGRVCLPVRVCRVLREETCNSCFASPSVGQSRIPFGADVDGAIRSLPAAV